MKTIILAAFMAIAATFTASAQDIRYVSGKAVDLSPLKAWLKTPTGERPLKHWKEVRIESFIAVKAGESQMNELCCRFSITIGDDTKIVSLRNVPDPAVEAFRKVESSGRQVQELSDYVAAERIRVRYRYANSPSKAPVGTESGEQIRQANVANADLQTRIEELDLLKSKHEAAKKVATKFSSELAMFTGQKYGDVEIWDCGRR